MTKIDDRADPNRFRSAAVELASQGFHVFRLVENNKTPKQPKYYEHATNDPEVVHRIWTDPDGHGERFNIGVLCGTPLPHGGILHVVDIDTKEGKVGKQSLVERPWLDRDTWTVLTASGGLHLYYSAPADGQTYRNTAGRIGQDIDSRGYHGYVVGPGSEINGKRYRLIDDSPIAPLSEQARAVIGTRKDVTHLDPTKALVMVDSDAAIHHAIGYLQSEEYPSAGKRNPVSFTVACRLKDKGISLDTAIDLAAQYWQFAYDDTDFRDELIKTFTSAYNNGSMPSGIGSSEHQFEDLSNHVDEEIQRYGNGYLDLGPDPWNKPLREPKGPMEFVSFLDMANHWKKPQPPAVLKGILLADEISVFSGQPKQGKSFLVIDILTHIAMGLAWNGHETAQGPVLYLYGEGGTAVYDRIGAAARYLGWDDTKPVPPMFAYPDPIDLFADDADANRLVEAIKRYEILAGAPFKAIAIDTLARSHSGDENNQQDINVVIGHLTHVKNKTGCHIILVHHMGKDVSKGSRGSSAIQGGVDTEVFIKDKVMSVHVQRNLAELPEFPYTLETYELGFRDNERIVTGYVRYNKPSPRLPEDDFPTGVTLDPVMPKGWPSFSICERILEAMQADAEGHNPWSAAPNLRESPRHAKNRIVADFGVTERIASQMVRIWLAQGLIEVRMIDTHTRQKGLIVVKKLAEVAAEVAKNRAEVEN